MSKFRESELTKNLKNFEMKNNIEIKLERGLEGKIILKDATVKFDEECGFINIKSEDTEFKINTTLVDEYQKNNDEILIYVESIIFKIKKYEEEI